jgi:hypothetical protein
MFEVSIAIYFNIKYTLNDDVWISPPSQWLLDHMILATFSKHGEIKILQLQLTRVDVKQCHKLGVQAILSNRIYVGVIV